MLTSLHEKGLSQKRTMNKALILLSCIIFLSSCAASYKPISPTFLSYPSVQVTEGLTYSYRFNVLSDAGNKKYAKKEQRKGIKVIAVKLVNDTGRRIVFKRDIDIYMGDQVILPMEASQVRQIIKQPAALFLLWSPLILFTTDCNGFSCDRTVIPIGAAIGVTNTIIASSANGKLDTEMLTYDILNREIANGDTAFGLIAISTDITSAIELRMK